MNVYKGSRGKLLELVESKNFLKTINYLLKPTGATVSQYDNWIPKGFNYDNEAELKDFLIYNFDILLGKEIFNWWIKHKHGNTRTPNFDLCSTCMIQGQRGVLLIEAKAHEFELINEKKGKSLEKDSSDDSVENHEHIEKAIKQAKNGIARNFPNIDISRDKCYQFSNRLAHAWWIANKGIPVVVLYLGFLHCNDMENGKNTLFNTDKDWQDCFLEHSKKVNADTLIDNWIDCEKSKFITICRSILL